MSRLSNIVFGALAVSLTFGAIQFASGSDLSVTRLSGDVGHASEVNRAAKADRVAPVQPLLGQGKTISFRVQQLADTSVLIRVSPVVAAAGVNNAKVAKASTSVTIRRPTLACEPVVSVLTEIARQLQPGRCVT